MTSSKAGIHSESFQCRAEKLGLYSSLWIWYLSGEATLRNTVCQEYSLGGEEELSGVILGLSLHVPKVMEEPVLPAPTLSHIVQCPLLVCVCACLCVLSPVHTCKVGFYAPTEVSLKLLHCSEAGWHQQLVELFPPPPPPSVFLSVCLSFLVLAQIKLLPEIFRWDFFFLLEFVNLPANNEGKNQFIPM